MADILPGLKTHLPSKVPSKENSESLKNVPEEHGGNAKKATPRAPLDISSPVFADMCKIPGFEPTMSDKFSDESKTNVASLEMSELAHKLQEDVDMNSTPPSAGENPASKAANIHQINHEVEAPSTSMVIPEKTSLLSIPERIEKSDSAGDVNPIAHEDANVDEPTDPVIASDHNYSPSSYPLISPNGMVNGEGLPNGTPTLKQRHDRPVLIGNCTLCGLSTMAMSFIECTDCHCVTHGHCVNPPIDYPPGCGWRCYKCLRRRSSKSKSSNFSTQTDDRVSAYIADENREWLPPKLRLKPRLAAMLPAKPNNRNLPQPPPVYSKPVALESGTIVPIRYAITDDPTCWSDPEEQERIVETTAYEGAYDIAIPPGMIPCEYCHMPHNGKFGSGRFCSAACARTVGGMSRRRLNLEKKELAEEEILVGAANGRGSGRGGGRGSRGGRGRGRGRIRGRGRGRGRGRPSAASVLASRRLGSEESSGSSVRAAARNENTQTTRPVRLSTATPSVLLESGVRGTEVEEDAPPTAGNTLPKERPPSRKRAREDYGDNGSRSPSGTHSKRDRSHQQSPDEGEPPVPMNYPGAKPGKGYKFCHECGKLVANRRFICIHCGATNPSAKIVKRPRVENISKRSRPAGRREENAPTALSVARSSRTVGATKADSSKPVVAVSEPEAGSTTEGLSLRERRNALFKSSRGVGDETPSESSHEELDDEYYDPFGKR